MTRHETPPNVDSQRPPADRADPRRGPARTTAAGGGATRRDFFLTVALAAAVLGCRGTSPPPDPSNRSAAPRPPADPPDLSADIRAVRDHTLKVESPPSFVFTTRFKDVP